MKKLLPIIVIFTCCISYGQEANDCVDAITVCGNTNISSNASGFGIQELNKEANPCSFEEVNSIWLSVNIATSGSLAFTIRPDDTNLEVDYDFFVFGPNNDCRNFDSPIRCNTTNPLQAGLDYNTTGLRDAETDVSAGPGAEGNSFVSSIYALATEQYYILIDRPLGDGGFSLEWTGTAGFFPNPDINKPTDIDICDADNTPFVDLTQEEASITSSTSATIKYFMNYESALDNINVITDPTQFAFPNSNTEIFVRVTNPNGCFEITDFKLLPMNFDTPPDLSYSVCDSDRDGQSDFSMVDIIDDAESSITDISSFEVTLHPSESDANANLNRIVNDILSTANTNLYIRVNAVNIANCFITYPVVLTITPNEFPSTFNLVQCDTDQTNSEDGITQMNLEEAFENNSGIEILYYATIADRNADNPITNPWEYTNTTPFDDQVYFKAFTEGCESIGEIVLEINPTTVNLNSNSPLQVCDENPDDDLVTGTFDLERIRPDSSEGLGFAFYANRDDVALEQNPLDGNYTATSSTIYLRRETDNQCIEVEEIELIVHPLPEIGLDDTYQICSQGGTLEIEASSGFVGYTWYKIDNAQQEVGNSNQIVITETGNYRLDVESEYFNSNQSTRCGTSTFFTVNGTNKPIIDAILIEDALTNNIVEVRVSGTGDYEYSINGENYQESNRFEDVSPGFYTVHVRDINGCGSTEEDISVIGFPKFFTPNGDGRNDTWQIIGGDMNADERAIHIYDRYGKLVKEISTNTEGWDGSMNGQTLPSADYWFRFTLDNGKEFKGHFTLKR